MKKPNTILAPISIGIFGVVWCFAICFAAAAHNPVLPFGGSLLFGITAMVVAVVYLTLFRHSPGMQATEAGGLSIFFTVAYVAAAMAANAVLVWHQFGNFNLLIVLCNLIINAVYAVVILYLEHYTRSLSQKIAITERKLADVGAISQKLGAILGMTEDPELRTRILKLKQSVDFSSNLTSDATETFAVEMETRLDTLLGLLSGQEDRAAIERAVHDAEIIWRTRAGVAMSRK